MLKVLTLGRNGHSGSCLAPKMKDVVHIWGIRLYPCNLYYHLIFTYQGKISGLVCFTLAVSLAQCFCVLLKTSSLFLPCVLTEILLRSSLLSFLNSSSCSVFSFLDDKERGLN